MVVHAGSSIQQTLEMTDLWSAKWALWYSITWPFGFQPLSRQTNWVQVVPGTVWVLTILSERAVYCNLSDILHLAQEQIILQWKEETLLMIHSWTAGSTGIKDWDLIETYDYSFTSIEVSEHGSERFSSPEWHSVWGTRLVSVCLTLPAWLELTFASPVYATFIYETWETAPQAYICTWDNCPPLLYLEKVLFGGCALDKKCR